MHNGATAYIGVGLRFGTYGAAGHGISGKNENGFGFATSTCAAADAGLGVTGNVTAGSNIASASKGFGFVAGGVATTTIGVSAKKKFTASFCKESPKCNG